MAFTEIKERKNKRYYYRVLSIRDNNRVYKKRKYLGVNLSKKQLALKEAFADKKLGVLNRHKERLDKVKNRIIKILKKNNIKKAGIFGSFARGNQRKNSDIDIVVEPPKGIGLGFVGIQFELEDKLKRKIDLITYNSIHPLLKERILNEEIRII